MENLFSTEVMLAVMGIFATIISGIGWLIKHFIQKRDERQQKVFEERNKERTKIEDRVTKLERKTELQDKHIRNITVIAMRCTNPDCKTKDAVAEYVNNNIDEG